MITQKCLNLFDQANFKKKLAHDPVTQKLSQGANSTKKCINVVVPVKLIDVSSELKLRWSSDIPVYLFMYSK